MTRRRGTTLIEVLLGLVILATLLAAVVTARGRFIRQAADAERRRALVAALDTQIHQWFLGDVPLVPMAAGGTLGTLPGATWRTQTRRPADAARLGCVVVRIEATDDRSPPTRTSVELLIGSGPTTQP